MNVIYFFHNICVLPSSIVPFPSNLGVSLTLQKAVPVWLVARGSWLPDVAACGADRVQETQRRQTSSQN